MAPSVNEPPLELNKAALFEVLGYEPHEGQMLVHESRAPRRVLCCGVRWGKSTCASAEAVAALLAPCEESLGWIVAPTLGLTDQVYARARFAMHNHLAHRIVEDDERERRMVVRNLGGGVSVMQARTADNPVGLLGAAIDWVVVDEAARMRRFVWEQVLSARLIDRRGWALLISTPTGCNHFWELVRRGEKGRDSDFESWRSPTRVNPHIDRTLIEAERARMSEESFAQEYEAAFKGEDKEPCDVCRGPTLLGTPPIVLRDGQVAKRCPECNGYVHEDGRTAATRGGDGRAHVKIIKIGGVLAQPPELPGDGDGASVALQDPQRN